MQNTYKQNQKSKWIAKQEDFISSLSKLPLIIVLRPSKIQLENSLERDKFLEKIEHLNQIGINHIEIAWSKNIFWPRLIREIKTSMPNLSLGIASVTSQEALNDFTKLELNYAMTPTWNQKLQEFARESNTLLIPGVFSPTEIEYAKCFGWRVIKLFPAAVLGLKYINIIKAPINSIPYIIAAGGIKAKEINDWLNSGHCAVALGRKIYINDNIDTSLIEWVKNRNFG